MMKQIGTNSERRSFKKSGKSDRGNCSTPIPLNALPQSFVLESGRNFNWYCYIFDIFESRKKLKSFSHKITGSYILMNNNFIIILPVLCIQNTSYDERGVMRIWWSSRKSFWSIFGISILISGAHFEEQFTLAKKSKKKEAPVSYSGSGYEYWHNILQHFSCEVYRNTLTCTYSQASEEKFFFSFFVFI